MGTEHDHKPLGPILAILGAVIVLAVATVVYIKYRDVTDKHSYIYGIRDQLRVFIIEDGELTRELIVDESKWYCEVAIFEGGDGPDPYDLAFPKGPIHFYFFEDIENKSMADNYSDLIIRMNPVIIEDELYVVLVFFGEGAYGKEVYYGEELLYVYDDDIPDSNYGIRLVKIAVEDNSVLII